MFQNMLALLLQASFFVLSQAAPIEAQVKDDILGFRIGGGIVGVILLILDLIVLFEVLQSTRPVPNKLLWCLLVIIFPFAGILIYFLFSHRKAHRRGYEVIP